MASPEYEAMRNDMQRTAMIEGIPRIERKIDALLTQAGLDPEEAGKDPNDPLVVQGFDGPAAVDLADLDIDGGTLAALEEAGITTEAQLREAMASEEGIAGIGDVRRQKIEKALGITE